MKKLVISVLVAFGLVVSGYTIYYSQVIESERSVVRQFREITRIADIARHTPEKHPTTRSAAVQAGNQLLDSFAELDALEVDEELEIIKSETMKALRARARFYFLNSSSSKRDALAFETNEAQSKAKIRATAFIREHGLEGRKEFSNWAARSTPD